MRRCAQSPRASAAGMLAALAVASAIVASCGSALPPSQTPNATASVPPVSESPRSSPTSVPTAPASPSFAAPSDSASPVPPASAESLTRLCANDTFPEPSELDCTDAVATALIAARAQTPEPIARAEMTWTISCPSEPCSTPGPNAAQVLLRFVTGGGVSVVIRRDESGALSAGGIGQLAPGELSTPPPFKAPPVGLAQLANPPSEVSNRSPAPLCGTEEAGLAGPFTGSVRRCFLGAILNESPAEFLSARQDAEGKPFTELWRFAGRGPIVVYTDAGGAWNRQRCAIVVLDDATQLFDHGDCTATPVN